MTSAEQFTGQTFTVQKNWGLSGQGDLPTNGFQQDDQVTIVPMLLSDPQTYALSWLDEEGVGTTGNLIYLDGQMSSSGQVVYFPSGEAVTCDSITLFIDSSGNNLGGNFLQSGIEPADGNQGTFTAEANPTLET